MAEAPTNFLTDPINSSLTSGLARIEPLLDRAQPPISSLVPRSQARLGCRLGGNTKLTAFPIVCEDLLPCLSFANYIRVLFAFFTMSSPFNVKNYYRFFNSISPNNTISAGVVYNINDPINMTIQETFSSTENWQLFYQSGVYFIRNYQSGADLQLGLTENDLTTPRLLLSSGALGQQWQITARSDNTWRITNGLVSNLSSLGIAPGGATVPAMDTDDTDGHWRIGINQSAGTISNTAMLATVTNVVVSDRCKSLLGRKRS